MDDTRQHREGSGGVMRNGTMPNGAAQGCGGRCGRSMEVFDALPRRIRDLINFHLPFKHCACAAQRAVDKWPSIPNEAAALIRRDNYGVSRFIDNPVDSVI